MKFDKTKNYLFLINKIDEYKGTFRCEICNSEKIVHFWKIKSNHDKSCGCIKGKSILKYHILQNGNVISETGIILNKKIAKGYESFKGKYVHRLVAEKYIPNPNNYKDVNHINGIKTDNRIENLEWCTRSKNIKHAWHNKLNEGGRGKINKSRLLSIENIDNIKSSVLPSRELGKIYNVSKTTILNIKNNKIYKIK
jgi:hypothetical protein